MSFGQDVALLMVNKFVKFDENSLHFVKVMADMLKIGKIYKIAIYGSDLAAMFFNKIKIFEGIWKTYSIFLRKTRPNGIKDGFYWPNLILQK